MDLGHFHLSYVLFIVTHQPLDEILIPPLDRI